MTKRADDGHWRLPAGAAEVGGSFASTAVAELADEINVEAAVDDLIPFGTLSAASDHTIHYPNGDVTHCFALLFLVRRWRGTPTPDGEEVVEARFASPDQPPEPMGSPASRAVEPHRAYRLTGKFQLA